MRSKRRSLLPTIGLCFGLLGVTGCFVKDTPDGPPQQTGRFSVQRFNRLHINDTGNSHSVVYEITFRGNLFPKSIRFPGNDWTTFNNVTQLPSNPPSWLVDIGSSTALLTQKHGEPLMEVVWDGRDDGLAMRHISGTAWHVPDYIRVLKDPDEVCRAGRIFDSVTLTQQWLPNQPSGCRGYLASLSPDREAVAWYREEKSGESVPVTRTLLVFDTHGNVEPPLVLASSQSADCPYRPST